MGVTRSEIFTKEQNELSLAFKVLAHPARIAIIQHIYKSKSCICGELVHEIGLAQATISQHLKELKLAGIIQGSIEGTSVCYCINEEKWQECREMIGEFLNLDFKAGTSCC